MEKGNEAKLRFLFSFEDNFYEKYMLFFHIVLIKDKIVSYNTLVFV